MKFSNLAQLTAAGVSAREIEVLVALGDRLSNREIASRLHVAVRTVESHVSALLRKLAAEERARLVEIARRIRAGPALPAASTRFVGRASELAAVESLLEQHRIVTIVGPAGCGKTRLATEFAARRSVMNCQHHEMAYVDLVAATSADAAPRIIGGLGIEDQTGTDFAPAARIALAGREMLLVVDNCEHVIGPASDIISRLVEAIAVLRVLCTSRQVLGASGEAVMQLDAMTVPDSATAASVIGSEAGRLFVERAGAANSRFGLDDSTAPAVARVCRQLDGLPLGIELVAARCRTMTVDEIARHLERSLDIVEQRGTVGRHRSLSTALEGSWSLLDGNERALLASVAELPVDVTVDVLEASGVPGAAETMTRLADRSLVTVDVRDGRRARYGLLETVRAFVRARGDTDASVSLFSAHARAQLARAEQVEPAGRGTVEGATESPGDGDLEVALRWAVDNDGVLADALVVRIAQLVEVRPSRRMLSTLAEVVSDARRWDTWSSEALGRAAQAITYLNLDEAERFAAASLLRGTDPRARMLGEWAVGWIDAYRGNEPEAREHLERAIDLAEHLGDRLFVASAHQALGIASAGAETAMAHLEEALGVFIVVGDLDRATNVRFMLARCAVDARCRLSEVPLWLDECERHATLHGLEHEQAHARLARGEHLQLGGGHGAACSLFSGVIETFRRVGDLRCLTRTLVGLAGTASATAGGAPEAVEYLLQAVPVTLAAADVPRQHHVAAALAQAAADAGDLTLAARVFGALAVAAAGVDTPRPGHEQLAAELDAPPFASFVSEGRAGGLDLIARLYPR